MGFGLGDRRGSASDSAYLYAQVDTGRVAVRQYCSSGVYSVGPHFDLVEQKLSCSFCSCLNLYSLCHYFQHQTFAVGWLSAALAHVEITMTAQN